MANLMVRKNGNGESTGATDGDVAIFSRTQEAIVYALEERWDKYRDNMTKTYDLQLTGAAITFKYAPRLFAETWMHVEATLDPKVTSNAPEADVETAYASAFIEALLDQSTKIQQKETTTPTTDAAGQSPRQQQSAPVVAAR